MKLNSVVEENYLYQIQDFYPEDLVQEFMSQPWHEFPYRNLDDAHPTRRIIELPSSVSKKSYSYVMDVIRPQIEEQCGVRFCGLGSVDWWMDKPEHQTFMHHDGTVPANAIIYWLPTTQQDLGTSFYHDPDGQKIIYQFPNVPNTGYLMFNPQSHIGLNKVLWHGMDRPVPAGVDRLITHVWFGPYQR